MKALLPLLLLFAAPAAAAADRPNIVVIVVDALRADHLSLYGYGRPTSPGIDSFAEGAVVFRDAVSQAPTTLLSFASLFTALSVPRHGVSGEDRALGDTDLTLAEILRIHGYRTAAFVGGYNLNPVFRLGRGFDKYSHADRTDSSFRETLPAALAWAADSGGAGGPFFLVAHGNDLHTPYAFPETGLFSGGYRPSPELKAMRPEEARVFGVRGGRLLLGPGKGDLALTPDDTGYLTARYDEGIRLADEAIGKFLAGLGERGLLERSIVVLTADHGEGLFDHEYFFHDFTLYDEALRVPLLIKAPGQKARTVGRQVRLIDLAPTLLDLAGIAPPRAAEGRSLRPLFGSARRRPGEPARGYDARYSVSVGPFGGAAIRDGRWKLIMERGTLLLFDLSSDPGERRDLAAAEKAKAEELAAALRAELAAGAAGPRPPALRRGAALPAQGPGDGEWLEELFRRLLEPRRPGEAAGGGI